MFHRCNSSHLSIAQPVEDVDQPGVGEAGGNVSCTKHSALVSGNLSLRLSPFNASYLQKVDLRCELASPKIHKNLRHQKSTMNQPEAPLTSTFPQSLMEPGTSCRLASAANLWEDIKIGMLARWDLWVSNSIWSQEPLSHTLLTPSTPTIPNSSPT